MVRSRRALMLEPAPRMRVRESKSHLPKPTGAVAVELSKKARSAARRNVTPRRRRRMGRSLFFIEACDGVMGEEGWSGVATPITNTIFLDRIFVLDNLNILDLMKYKHHAQGRPCLHVKSTLN